MGPMGPPGGPQFGPQPLPTPFLDSMKFVVPPNLQDKYKAAHAKYAKPSETNPLKVNIAGDTTFDLTLKTN
jgi:hypothetical protein